MHRTIAPSSFRAVTAGQRSRARAAARSLARSLLGTALPSYYMGRESILSLASELTNPSLGTKQPPRSLAHADFSLDGTASLPGRVVKAAAGAIPEDHIDARRAPS
eukprot:751917-Prymnesium_polylepis.1